MTVCIAEKPSVARDIAAILGATSRHDGYYEGNGWQVTWTLGHLCSLKEPQDYTPYWTRWSLSALPMVPEPFSIKLRKDKGVEHQFKVIETLFSNADKIVNCGDAGQEGELIQRWVMLKAGVKCPVYRLWISSLTDESIREGFANLKPEKEFDNLYFAGMTRAIGDWLLGMNATRLYSLKYSHPGQVLSVGRVQTPTLALIVNRHFEIQNFKPEDSFELHTLYRNADFTAQIDRFPTEELGAETLQKVKGEPLTILSVTPKEGRESAPRLFDLTSLQVETNRRWGWSAEETLSLIQRLYEAKLTTYPRVDTTYLTDDIYPKIPTIFKGMEPYAAITEPLLTKGRLPKSKRVFDNSKVTDHHAIIPTGVSPRGVIVDPREKQLYHLIALRFIAAFYPDCRFNLTEVEATAADIKFKARGKVITDPGWRSLYDNDVQQQTTGNERDPDETTLPAFTPGESGEHAPSLKKRTTQPPKPYTEGTLLRAMETAGKTLGDSDEDSVLREALKENGIGRPSTRASIIETLFRRGYIRRQRKAIHPTDAGISLINTIQEPLLKSARLTGIWENKLRRIERGLYSPAEFMGELKDMVSALVISVMKDNQGAKIFTEEPKATPAVIEAKPKKTRVTKLEHIVCLRCGKGHIIKGRTAYGCSEYSSGCEFRMPFDETVRPDLTPGALNKLIKKSKKA